MRCGALVVILALLAGCGEDRAPIPILHVLIRAEHGQFELNGRPMDQESARAEIQRLADANRRPTTAKARLIVRTRLAAGASAAGEAAVVNWCQNAGIDQIQPVR